MYSTILTGLCKASYSTGLLCSSIKALYKRGYTFSRSWLVENLDDGMCNPFFDYLVQFNSFLTIQSNIGLSIWFAMPWFICLYVNFKIKFITIGYMYNRFMKLCQSVVPYALNSQKRVTHSTIKVLHQPTSSECVTTFPCSLPRSCPNDIKGKLQKFAMHGIG